MLRRSDIATRQRGSARIVVDVGEEAGGQLAHHTALPLTERLGSSAVTSPGDQAGYRARPEAFTEQRHEVFPANDPERVR